ncbi:MAG: hypothetical protein ACK40G_17200 [Cytophagaceae bacterium]
MKRKKGSGLADCSPTGQQAQPFGKICVYFLKVFYQTPPVLAALPRIAVPFCCFFCHVFCTLRTKQHIAFLFLGV